MARLLCGTRERDVSTFVLLLILILPEQEPKIKQVPMPDLMTCFNAAYSFMQSEEYAKAISRGGVRQAACGEVFPKGDPA